jgi:hypothetical protein
MRGDIEEVRDQIELKATKIIKKAVFVSAVINGRGRRGTE